MCLLCIYYTCFSVCLCYSQSFYDNKHNIISVYTTRLTCSGSNFNIWCLYLHLFFLSYHHHHHQYTHWKIKDARWQKAHREQHVYNKSKSSPILGVYRTWLSRHFIVWFESDFFLINDMTIFFCSFFFNTFVKCYFVTIKKRLVCLISYHSNTCIGRNTGDQQPYNLFLGLYIYFTP